MVVPARDEEGNVGSVVRDLLALRGDGGEPLVDDFVVCDNGSADATARRARAAGARVVREETPGYGIACLTALGALRPVDVVLFTDGDRSFVAGQSVRLLDAIAAGADFAVGSRALGRREPGALSPPQILGNRLAGFLIRALWGRRVTDLGPYRAIRAEALRRLDMRATAYGWTVEMQVKAIQHRLRMVEAPVDTVRRRAAAEQMAYWINLYNAVTVQVVLGGYPVESIREIHEGLVPLTGPWGDVHANVAGQDLTLDDIEHRILRPIWKDPRIHYAVNCAAYGCPHLIATAFTADNLEELLDQGARDYVNHLRGVDVLDEAFAVVSSIYSDDWYREDFGVTDAEVLAHFLQYADAELAEQLRGFDGIMEYDYDWRLNEPPATEPETTQP